MNIELHKKLMSEAKGYFPGAVFLMPVERLFAALGDSPIFLLVSKSAFAAHEPLFKKLTPLPESATYSIAAEPTEVDLTACIQKISVLSPETVVLAFGGGACLDVAKAAGKDTGRPVIAVPTTPGSGSEASPYALLTDAAGEKKYLSDQALLPSIVVLDPMLLQSIPRIKLGAMLLDSAAHAIEAVYSRRSNPLAEAYAHMALEKLEEVATSEEPRYVAMQLAGFFGGIAQGIAGTGLVHALAHKLGAPRGLSHADAVARFLLPTLKISLQHNEVSSRFRTPLSPGRLFSLLERLTAAYPPERTGVELPSAADALIYMRRDPCFLMHPFRPTEEELAVILSA